MKIFKYIVYLSVISLVSAIFFGCSKSNVGLNSNNESKAVVVSLSFNGDINSEDSPLTKATSDDLYGVRINEIGGDNKLLAGLFDNVDNITAVLYTNKKYNITCTMVKGGKRILPSFSGGYAQPFLRRSEAGLYKIPTDIGVGFTEGLWFVGLDSSYVFLDPYASPVTQGDGSLSDKYPAVYRFYGKLTNYTPTEYTKITLKCTSFGLRYKVTGVTDGSVSVVIKNSSKTFFSNDGITADFTSEDKIFSFHDIIKAWQYADTYTETVNLAVVWTRGAFVQDLGNVDVTVKRNAMNTINISLKSSTSNAGFGITKDATPMGGTTVTVPVG